MAWSATSTVLTPGTLHANTPNSVAASKINGVDAHTHPADDLQLRAGLQNVSARQRPSRDKRTIGVLQRLNVRFVLGELVKDLDFDIARRFDDAFYINEGLAGNHNSQGHVSSLHCFDQFEYVSSIWIATINHNPNYKRLPSRTDVTLGEGGGCGILDSHPVSNPPLRKSKPTMPERDACNYNLARRISPQKKLVALTSIRKPAGSNL